MSGLIKDCHLTEIRRRLEKWRADRNLSTQSQQAGYVGNLLEELTEYARAQNDEERIDALCDIIVFSLNTLYKTQGFAVCELKKKSLIQPACLARACLDGVDNAGVLNLRPAENVINIAFNTISQLGYNVFQCLDETLKEIESRTGKYDKSIGKFIKDKGAYSLEDFRQRYPEFEFCEVLENVKDFLVAQTESVFPKWYKAKYERCKNGES